MCALGDRINDENRLYACCPPRNVCDLCPPKATPALCKKRVSQASDEAKAVYAIPTDGDNLAVLFSCNRTTSLSDAADDLKVLRAMESPFFKFERKPTFPELDFFGDPPGNCFRRTGISVSRTDN